MNWKQEAKARRIDAMIEKIVEFMLDNGFPPTQGQISAMCQVRVSTVSAWIAEARATGKLDTAGSRRAMGIMVPGVYYVDDRGKR